MDSAELRQHTHLGDVSHVALHPRAEDQPDHGPGLLLRRHKGSCTVEEAAPRKTDDIVQESECALRVSILIINFGVNMPLVASGDQCGGGLVILLRPGTNVERR